MSETLADYAAEAFKVQVSGNRVRWEYQVLRDCNTATLNEAGADGWELVCYLVPTTDNPESLAWFYFKRVKAEL